MFTKIRYNSPVVLTFVIICFVILGLNNFIGNWLMYNFFCVYRFSLTDILGYVRLFTHVLGHADLSHCISNMTLILVLGPMLEEKYGSKILLESIAITALVSGILHCLVSSGALLGASGIVFMMIMMASLGGMERGTIPLTMILVAIIYIGGEIVDGILNQDSISQLTHIIGGICGTVIGMGLGKKRG